MEYQGVVTDPYYKPVPHRMNQVYFESSVDDDDDDDEEEDSDEEGPDEHTDFGASLETFTNSCQLELEDLIQDLNLQLERVSFDVEQEGEGGEGGSGGVGGDGGEPCGKDGHQSMQKAQVEEVKGDRAALVGIDVEIRSKRGSGLNEADDEEEDDDDDDAECNSRKVFSSDSDTDSVIIVNTPKASVANGSGVGEPSSGGDSGGSGLIQPSRRAGSDFDNYELCVRKAIRDLSCLTELMVRCGLGTACLYACVLCGSRAVVLHVLAG